ncbi:MAG TPA: phospholipase D-like domain-containing protein [Aliidongia sp.]|nr:phospholipase D-like domain-containing protein [Aliidongia sp.]
MSPMFEQIAAASVAILHLLVAASITAHVLLTKRDIGSSIGWIGIGWLAPFAGGLLYLVFGVNRVTRRAQRLRPRRPIGGPRHVTPRTEPEDKHLLPLERAALRITQRPAEPGNRIEILHQGDEAYPRMIEAIRAAEHTIALSSYIFRADQAGQGFIEALIDAHGRGVTVRVLLDGIGSGYFHAPAAGRLRRGGVPTAQFMHSPLPWRMPFLNLRTHKKILCVDGRIGFTGGLNIGDENVLERDPRVKVRDTHFAVEGPIVSQLVEAFAEDWLFATGEALDGGGWFPSLHPAGAVTARVVTSGPDEDLEKIEFLALQAIGLADTSLSIMTPYFLPDERMITGLALAAMRGVAVDIIIPAESNHGFMDWAMRAQIGPLLAAGCRIWRNPPPFDHSKLMTIDGAWSLVGSANWDMRSFRLNFELNMALSSPEFAREIEALMAAKRIDRLTGNDLDRRSLPVRLRDAGIRLLLPYL